jgi:outer membrane protein assembly factor BamD (BamD/ComL family)
MRTADDLFATANDLGGEHHLRMARFYLKQNAVASALVHLRRVMTDYPTSACAPRAASLVRLIAGGGER